MSTRDRHPIRMAILQGQRGSENGHNSQTDRGPITVAILQGQTGSENVHERQRSDKDGDITGTDRVGEW